LSVLLVRCIQVCESIGHLLVGKLRSFNANREITHQGSSHAVVPMDAYPAAVVNLIWGRCPTTRTPRAAMRHIHVPVIVDFTHVHNVSSMPIALLQWKSVSQMIDRPKLRLASFVGNESADQKLKCKLHGRILVFELTSPDGKSCSKIHNAASANARAYTTAVKNRRMSPE
jgi:hypothetical protein